MDEITTAEITTLGLIPFPAPIKVTVGSNVYALRGYTEVPSSQSQWAKAEEERGFKNTPWAANGDSAALASQFTEYAFLASPAYWEGTPPVGATYELPGTEPATNQGILYYKGDGQLHYTRGSNNENQKVVFYIGEDVDYYVRHDEDNNVSDPQPGFTTAMSPLEGSGWTAIEYRNYNADYVAREPGFGLTARTVQPYVRHGQFGEVVPVARYVRMDEDNNPVVAQPGIATVSSGVIYAPKGLVEGRTIYVQAAEFSGGTPPFTFQAQLQRNDGSGWVGFTGWETVGEASRVLSSDEVGFNLRANTRGTDRNTPEGEFIIAPGISTVPVTATLALNQKGTLSGTGKVGSVLTQTAATFVGGAAPFTFKYQFVRREVGGQGFFDFGAPEALTYTIQASDLGYEIRGRTIVTDAFGFKVNSSSTTPTEIVVIE